MLQQSNSIRPRADSSLSAQDIQVWSNSLYDGRFNTFQFPAMFPSIDGDGPVQTRGQFYTWRHQAQPPCGRTEVIGLVVASEKLFSQSESPILVSLYAASNI